MKIIQLYLTTILAALAMATPELEKRGCEDTCARGGAREGDGCTVDCHVIVCCGPVAPSLDRWIYNVFAEANGHPITGWRHRHGELCTVRWRSVLQHRIEPTVEFLWDKLGWNPTRSLEGEGYYGAGILTQSICWAVRFKIHIALRVLCHYFPITYLRLPCQVQDLAINSRLLLRR
jgi:hypothetical protein